MNIHINKNTLTRMIKNSMILNFLYKSLGNILIFFLGIFIKQKDNCILFVSFGGRNFDDSPKAIYEYMKADIRFQDYDLIYAVNKNIKSEHKEAIAIDTIKYYITVLKAKCWITNVSIARGLDFSRRQALYFNTWHGIPIKYLENNKVEKFDFMNVQGAFDKDIFMKLFKLNDYQMLEFGLPRNDVLVINNNSEYIEQLRIKFNLNETNKIILYAPTFRKYDANYNKFINLDHWIDVLGENYYILLRRHSAETNKIIYSSKNIIDVSNYYSLNDLILLSDILISDYSSIFFDYSITHKPMFYYIFDFKKYNESNGFFINIFDEIDGSKNEEELLKIVINSSNSDKTIKFCEKYNQYYGNATKKTVDFIYKKLKG